MKRHHARLGPCYWGWRCVICSHDSHDRQYHLRWWERGPDWKREFFANLVLASFIVIMIVAILVGKQP